MKKTALVVTTLLLLLVLTLGTILPAAADSNTVSGTWGSLSWELNKTSGELVISGEGEMNNFNLMYVDAWHRYSSSIKTVTIESGVTSISNNAFYGCSGLTSVEIPDSVTSIGTAAFGGCSGLTNIEIPKSVTSVALNAFRTCINIEFANIPSVAISAIPKDSLKTVVINGGESIPSNAFLDCVNLTSVTLSDSITTIGSQAFKGCNVTQADNGVLYVGKWAVGFEEGVTSVQFRSDTAGISDQAFYNCKTLTSVVIQSATKFIGNLAFSGCDSLTKVTVSSGVNNIGEKSFQNCSNLMYFVFCGTKEQWIDVQKAATWNSGAGEYTFQYHDFEEGVVTMTPTHFQNGIMTFYCICGESHTEIIEKNADSNHEYGPVGRYNDTDHIQYCPCGAIKYENHIWNRGKCEACGEFKSKSGCGSVIGGGAALLLLIGGAGCMIARKKKEN